jgi:O-antigen/teichoic acid export membrane protein
MKNSISNLFKHSAIYAVATYLQRFLSFLMLPFYTRTEYISTLAEFGDYILLYTFIAFVNFLFILGQDVAYLKFRHFEHEEQKNIFFTVISNVLFQSIVLSTILIVFRNPISHGIGISNSFFMIFAAGIVFFDTLSNPFYSHLRLEEKSVTFSAIKILRFLMELGLNILFVVYLKKGIYGILYANLIAALVNTLILFILHAGMFPARYQFNLAKKLWTYGITFVPAGIAFVAIEQADKILVNLFLTKEDVSIYGASYKFGTILLFVVIAFRNAWQPYFLRVAKEEKNAPEIFAKVIHYIMFFMTILWIGLALFLGEILTTRLPLIGSILGNPVYWAGVKVIPIVLLSYVYYSMYIGFSPGYYIKNKGIYLSFFTIIGFITNVGINLLFLSKYGYMVAAWATLAAYFSMTILNVTLSRKLYPIPFRWKKLAGMMIIHSLILWISLQMNIFISVKIIVFLSSIAILIGMDPAIVKGMFDGSLKLMRSRFYAK